METQMFDGDTPDDDAGMWKRISLKKKWLFTSYTSTIPFLMVFIKTYTFPHPLTI